MIPSRKEDAQKEDNWSAKSFQDTLTIYSFVPFSLLKRWVAHSMCVGKTWDEV